MRSGMRSLLFGVTLLLAACGPVASPPVASPLPEAARHASPPKSLQVDHAWVKNAPTPGARTKQKQQMDTLRAKVLGGSSFTAAWNALNYDGALWHVADGETYPYEVVSEEARDLAVGSVSEVIPGNGGLHLFRIVAHDPAP